MNNFNLDLKVARFGVRLKPEVHVRAGPGFQRSGSTLDEGSRVLDPAEMRQRQNGSEIHLDRRLSHRHLRVEGASNPGSRNKNPHRCGVRKVNFN